MTVLTPSGHYIATMSDEGRCQSPQAHQCLRLSFLQPSEEEVTQLKVDLASELAKGPHYGILKQPKAEVLHLLPS